MADDSTMRCAALLRGVNVGGNNRVPMKALAEALSERGACSVSTYLQSGNVLLSCATSAVGEVQALVAGTILDTLGLTIGVVVRTHDQLEAVIAANPYPVAETAPTTVHVAFLGGLPTVEAVAQLDRERFLPDELEVRGADVYVHYANGAGRTKVSLERLGVPVTARNWNTVIALARLTA